MERVALHIYAENLQNTNLDKLEKMLKEGWEVTDAVAYSKTNIILIILEKEHNPASGMDVK